MTTPMSSTSTWSYEYLPSFTQGLLDYLATYKLDTFPNNPSAVDAVAVANVDE